MSVSAWTEEVIIPTYQVGKPDPNPMFFEKRVYQGSSGVVYPNPIIEKIFDEKVDQAYQGVFLENEYLKIMILPELGGRVQMAFDKVKQRHFIYYNQVIKPALVGLCGPWISGGIEFNWPQHHRPSTYEALEFSIEEAADGSKTVWVNEIEKMFHTKGMAGFALHPGKAYLEIKAKLANLTSMPQTFLWWANPAVKVHDYYQSVFPPDVNAVFDHGKRDVSSFPIATGTYYKMDYAPGTDISKYKNIPVPTSYMAINSKYDFVGGYEHDIQAGMLHVADHHVSPGKKQWTWGNGDFGLAWDRNLTDEDGPYIELMAGVFTDNQPDFTWLKPFEEKTFTQYFLPYTELGMVKNASKDLLIGMDRVEEKLIVKVFATSQQVITIQIDGPNQLTLKEDVSIGPEHPRVIEFPAMGFQVADFQVSLRNKNGKEVLAYKPIEDTTEKPLPLSAKPAQQPAEIATNEQLFLTGQHLEQYRHATYRPMPYYLEALKRDPSDIRCNNAVGKWYLKRGVFAESVVYFQKAIDTMTERNPNPYDCEPYYNLGLANLYLDRIDLAYDAFFKATWDSAYQDSAYLHVAQIDVIRGRFEQALPHVEWALDRNARNGKAYVLKSIILNNLGNELDASVVLEEALKRDHFNLAARFELYQHHQKMFRLDSAQQEKDLLQKYSGGASKNAITYVIDYINCGAYQKALSFLQMVVPDTAQDPMVNYYLGYIAAKMGRAEQSQKFLKVAAQADSSYCFPNRLFDINILEFAIRHDAADAKAPYYLGNLYYDKQQYDLAIRYWEQSAAIDSQFPTVFRNLGLASYNKKHNSQQALYDYELAFSLNQSDARILMELDALYKKLNKQPVERLAFLTENAQLAQTRDDLVLEIVSLQNLVGDHQKALDTLTAHHFHPWEGGEGKVSEQYRISLISLAKQQMAATEYANAINMLERSLTLPQNLGEGKLRGTPENDTLYWLGCCYEALNNSIRARHYWMLATAGLAEPGMALFYNDQQPDQIYYQGLAWLKLGETEQAEHIFKKLVAYGEAHLNDEVSLDYFAVSLPDLLIFESDLKEPHEVHCLLVSALGYLGLGREEDASILFDRVLAKDATKFVAKMHLEQIQKKNIK